MARIYPDWDAATSYKADDYVKNNGVLYQAEEDISGNASNMEPRLDEDRWRVAAVLDIINYFGLIEAVRLQLNQNGAEDIVDSVPMFISLAETSFKTRLRVPDQRTTVILTTDTKGAIQKPQMLPDIINMRINGESPGNFELTSRGHTQINASNYQEYIELLRIYSTTYFFRPVQEGYDYPVYWETPTEYLIAPLLDAGTEIELVYHEEIPNLGTVDANGDDVLTNWFLTEAPQMLLYGALLESAPFLRDSQYYPLWQDKFAKAEIETKYKIELSETSGPHFVNMRNFYSV